MRSSERYKSQIMTKLSDTFDVLYKIGLVILSVTILIRLIFTPGEYYYLVDVALLISTHLVYMATRKLTKLRMQSMTAILLLVGVISYYFYGTTGTGYGIILVGLLVSAVFTTDKFFYGIIFTSMASLGLVMVLRDSSSVSLLGSFHYIQHFALMYISVIMIRLAVNALKKVLLKNIEELDVHLSDNKKMLEDLKFQHDALKSNKMEIYELAYFDQLTGLPKVNYFEKFVNGRLETNKQATIMIADLKDFKLINSVYGSSVGDHLLKLVAEVIEYVGDPLLHACRINGDEFLFWYESTDVYQMKKQLDIFLLEFNVRVRKLFTYSNVQFHMAYAMYPEDGHNFMKLYDKLHIALEFVKASPENKLLRYTDEMQRELHEENHLKELVDDAINRRSFEVHYQEKFDNEDNVIGLEALARWHSDDLGDVEPAVFIPVVNKYQMTSSFERLIIGKVFTDYKTLQKIYGKVNVSINVSPGHLLTSKFSKYFKDALMLYRIDPTDIVLELTEDVIQRDMIAVYGVLEELRAVGVKISLDNFGAGYTSLKNLNELPFDEIKVDRTFIKNIEDVRVQHIFKTFMAFKESYGLDIIAEGVEDKKQLDILRTLGCDKFQGYLYSRPDELKKLEDIRMEII